MNVSKFTGLVNQIAGIIKKASQLIRYAREHGKTIVVAHGLVDRELIKILNKKGWKSKSGNGNGNLSVTSLEKPVTANQ